MANSILTSIQKQVLYLLSKESNFTNNFYLTGGTALSEYYLHHRLSEDLDFFSQKEVDSLWLTTLTNKLKQKLKADKVDLQQSFNRNLVFFTFNQNLLKTEFTYFPFPHIEKSNIFNDIAVDTLLDIAVNKFFTIYQKPSARHFIDLYLIIKNSTVAWGQLANLARNKFDTFIDPVQLGSQLVTASEIQDLPKMLVDLKEHEWRDYFIDKARALKSELEK
ncbi:MAG: nucleotidyl transferase AbiEii/AbiGii toxin family protein [Candidatus Levybacteria bacterium]|nr:nucleotidyl transferase AbiEii/AbiGii toxin family protein [Candidatus Levybacteria bacterium]